MNRSLLAQIRSPAIARMNAGIRHNTKPGVCPRCGGKTTTEQKLHGHLGPVMETSCTEKCGWFKVTHER